MRKKNKLRQVSTSKTPHHLETHLMFHMGPASMELLVRDVPICRTRGEKLASAGSFIFFPLWPRQ